MGYIWNLELKDFIITRRFLGWCAVSRWLGCFRRVNWLLALWRSWHARSSLGDTSDRYGSSDSVTIRRRRGTPRRGNIVWKRSAQPILCLNELRMAAGNLPPYCAASTPLIVLIRVFCRSCSSLFYFSCSRGIGEQGRPGGALGALVNCFHRRGRGASLRHQPPKDISGDLRG
jgi:hypothetical protein